LATFFLGAAAFGSVFPSCRCILLRFSFVPRHFATVFQMPWHSARGMPRHSAVSLVVLQRFPSSCGVRQHFSLVPQRLAAFFLRADAFCYGFPSCRGILLRFSGCRGIQQGVCRGIRLSRRLAAFSFKLRSLATFFCGPAGFGSVFPLCRGILLWFSGCRRIWQHFSSCRSVWRALRIVPQHSEALRVVPKRLSNQLTSTTTGNGGVCFQKKCSWLQDSGDFPLQKIQSNIIVLQKKTINLCGSGLAASFQLNCCQCCHCPLVLGIFRLHSSFCRSVQPRCGSCCGIRLCHLLSCSVFLLAAE